MAFHYFGAIEKFLKGSAIEDIIIKSRISASGLFKGVLYGKYYNQAMREHGILVEAFERLLLESFEINKDMTKISDAATDEFKGKILVGSQRDLMDFNSFFF